MKYVGTKCIGLRPGVNVRGVGEKSSQEFCLSLSPHLKDNTEQKKSFKRQSGSRVLFSRTVFSDGLTVP